MNQKYKRKRRGVTLIAEFINGYAQGWYFAVGECFRDQLDIKLTDRIIIEPDEMGINKKKITSIWTQGQFYCFEEGHIFYDTLRGKESLFWKDALKSIKHMCEIIRATPNQIDNKNNFITGQVTFKLSRTNNNKSGLITIGQYHLSQDKFIDFLKTGEFDELSLIN